MEVLNTDEKAETEKREEERVALSRTGTNGNLSIFVYCEVACTTSLFDHPADVLAMFVLLCHFGYVAFW